ncbi:ATP-binding cassette domain-containing protein [Oleidesulfovibrio sp.]|uniref:ATP-binding cassette domain-containing protein n=1 Tax=Oleidesulfovibrio sp. TaxID=2909707 RepID=UPI003A835EE1
MTLTARICKALPHYTLDVELECPCGHLTAIVGPSGAGKTTLIRCLAGLEAPDSGTVALNNIVWCDTAKHKSIPVRHRKLGFVFQDYPLFPHLDVLGNVAFATGDKKAAQMLLERLGIGHLAKQKPSSVSGGEKQRVAMCQALARKPSLLLLDEPFSALDVDTRRSLRLIMLDLKAELNIPIVHVTHDLEEAALLGDSILAVNAGKADEKWLWRNMPTRVQRLYEPERRTAESGSTPLRRKAPLLFIEPAASEA